MTAHSKLDENFWWHHLFWPLTTFAFAAAIMEISMFDLLFADSLFRLEGLQWALKDHFITSTLLHDGAQGLSKVIALLLLVIALTSPYNRHLRPYRRGWWFLFASMASAAAIVSIGKQVTQIHCPWDLTRYGGVWPYVSLFETLPVDVEAGRCFPAGHASAGYAFLALYFFALRYQPDKRWLGLVIGIGMGLIYGFTQQLRGAHFLSHDMWTLAICWFSGLFWYWLLFFHSHSAPPGISNNNTSSSKTASTTKPTPCCNTPLRSTITSLVNPRFIS